jgi:hypothetical protein
MQEITMNKIIPISKKARKKYGWLDIQPYMCVFERDPLQLARELLSTVAGNLAVHFYLTVTRAHLSSLGFGPTST